MFGFGPFSEFPLSTLTGVTFVSVTGVYATSGLGLVSVAANADVPVVGTGAQTYLGIETVSGASTSAFITGIPATVSLGIINGNASRVNSWVDVITNTSGNHIVDEGPMFGGASFSAIPFSSITQTTYVSPTLNTWVDVNVTQLPNWHV